jgi:hypothetical protein
MRSFGCAQSLPHSAVLRACPIRPCSGRALNTVEGMTSSIIDDWLRSSHYYLLESCFLAHILNWRCHKYLKRKGLCLVRRRRDAEFGVRRYTASLRASASLRELNLAAAGGRAV